MYASDLLFCVSKTRLRKRRPFGGAVLSLSFSLLLLHHDHKFLTVPLAWGRELFLFLLQL